MGFMKGQGATEYLVLLAVVLIVALVSIALLGFFPGLATDAKITQSVSYWKEVRPLSIQEYRVVGATGNATLVIQNNDASGTYTITDIRIFNNYTPYSTTVAPGETKVFYANAPGGAAGSIYDLNVSITYTTPAGINTTFYGAKNLVGKYS
ncbi:MAG: hypothetical protein N3E51_00065 [Candidatus Micrarchaeota archaeon]|nr:hypothetical protein [Candidatus Micrarchaeota archaeon]